jgi:predicted Ser/Thr protein kinase
MDLKITPSLAETVASPEISRVISSIEDEGRFLPGTLLGGRYRIIALLGRGGMGEVYRATDLTLGQSVALKFLPEEASKNQRLLERFHGEVRVARLVSHPNVCRVYDIGEVEGMPFISMEYVDGEDLASLLTRIGRLPSDKAIETARKLCAGLAAAHDRGVIHRDLKPQNIMMNKRGEVVIMDFGLAAIADQLNGPEARNGTPAYMSPEQLRGEAVTGKSDIYALGLVLYEIFTGKPPFSAASVQQLIDMQQSMHLTSVTSVAADVDPAVEKVIRRCLEPDPGKRPATPMSVMAALPGGDPLAAAMAAGETPSPEMVAAAGTIQGMARKNSIPLLVLVVVALLGTIPIRNVRTAMVHAPLDHPPDVLAHEARTFAQQFGYDKTPADSFIWLEHRESLLMYLGRRPAPRAWDVWFAAESPILALYREGPGKLEAEPFGLVSFTNPPPTETGMVQVQLDGGGRLRDFTAVPYPEGSTASTPVAAETVLRAAGLDPAKFTEIGPTGRPDSPFDRRQAWKGPHPVLPNTMLTLEVAWLEGRVVAAHVTFPYMQAGIGSSPRVPSLGETMRDAGLSLLIGLGSFCVLLRALGNWRRNRTDQQGAWRVAAASFLLTGIDWAGAVHPVGFGSTMGLAAGAAAQWLLPAVALWLVYLALEPEVRARYPHSIVTWNRVLAGRWLDAQVGSHVLIGAAVGTGLWAVFKLVAILVFKINEPNNWDIWLGSLMGAREWLGGQAASLNWGLRVGLIAFVATSGLRRLLRNDILAAAAAAILATMTVDEVVSSRDWWMLGLLFASMYGTLIFVLLRCGLVATIAAVFFGSCVNRMALGADWNAWYTPASLATFILLCGITGLAFWRSLGGRELLAEEQ